MEIVREAAGPMTGPGSSNSAHADVEVPAPNGSYQPLEVSGMVDAVATFRSKNIVHSAALLAGVHREVGGEAEVCLREFVGDALTFSNGESHRTRRKVLNQLVRPEALDHIRDEIVTPQAREQLPQFVTQQDDGRYRVDLVAFCDRVFLHFAAKFIGLIGVETTEQLDRLQACVTPLSNAVTSAFYKDRAAIHAAALVAKARYVEEFFRPSVEAHRAKLAEVQAGRLAPEMVPMNFIHLVVTGAHPEYEDESQAIRESAILFVATVASSTLTVVNSVGDLSAWLAEHPEHYHQRADHDFVLDAMQESLRLRSPFSPYVVRMAALDTTVAGCPAARGQEIRVSIPGANSDPTIWGEDAHKYNPLRQVPEGLRRYGISFGVGPHQCLGQRVVMGSDGTGGAHVRLLQRLLAVGARPDPENAARQGIERKESSGGETADVAFPRWETYPAILDDWDPALETADLHHGS